MKKELDVMRASLEGLTFHVLDVEKSREFYERIPGTVLEAHRPGEFALFRIGKSHLGLLQSKKSGLHLEVNTPNVDEFHAELVAAGVEALSAPRDRPWAERTFNVRDPDGNLIEFQ
jgi:catechol 2,3-dioxygenase-like lactoylglutathione lyase family enzyme